MTFLLGLIAGAVITLAIIGLDALVKADVYRKGYRSGLEDAVHISFFIEILMWTSTGSTVSG